ncbi:hypothetical protein CDD83_7954 [Cordyceps sp. RAO-2017]|nr:hypothetical protein CDD83_7954 [Cordyceps sp. RAO-2017]
MDSLAAGFSIGRFSAHRPSRSADQIPHISQLLHSPSQEDASLSDSAARKNPPPRSSTSWLAAAKWKSPKPAPVIVRSGQDLHRILTPLPPVLATTTSALAPSPRIWDSRASHRPERRRAVGQVVAGSLTPEASWAMASSRPAVLHVRSASHEPAHDTCDHQRLFTGSRSLDRPRLLHQHGPQLADRQPAEEWSASVQQLLRETGQTDEPADKVPVDSQMTSWLLDAPESPEPESPVPATPLSASPPSPPAAVQERRKGGRLFEKKTPPPRKASLSRSKSQRRRRGRKPTREVAKPGRFPGKATPWALAGSVGNALGQRFKRVVADEMLTPDRMEELKRSRQEAQEEAEARQSQEGRWSTDSSRSASTDQSDRTLGPFHLEDLAASPPKTTTAAADSGRASPAMSEHRSRPSPVSPSGKEVVHSSSPSPPRNIPKQRWAAREPEAGAIGEFTFPAPPLLPSPPALRTGARAGARSPLTLRLSTIPEAPGPKAGEEQGRPAGQGRDGGWRGRRQDEDEKVIYLKSTPLSSANRAFRHGPIVFPRPETDMGKCRVEDVDETVDWTAFQMAILGGAGDLMSGMYEDDQNLMADEMVEWFETFGFETHGQLIAANGPRRQDASQLAALSSSASSAPAAKHSDAELPIPVQSERHFMRRRDGYGRPGGGADTVRFFRSGNKKRGGRHGETEGSLRRGQPGKRGLLAPESLRARPRPLVVGEEVPEEASERMTETAPMGCNLERDLDEFLRWERQFAFGGVF